MKDFKQIAFGLLVGAMAIGFSAFTNAEKSEGKLLAFRYVNTGTNYELVPDAQKQNCAGESSQICIIETDTDLGQSFDYDQLPSDAVPYDNSIDGIYNPE